jgi:hypothetical protein
MPNPPEGAVDSITGDQQVSAAGHGGHVGDPAGLNLHTDVCGSGPQQFQHQTAPHAVPEAGDGHRLATLDRHHLVGPGVSVLAHQPPGFAVVRIELAQQTIPEDDAPAEALGRLNLLVDRRLMACRTRQDGEQQASGPTADTPDPHSSAPSV